MKTTSTKPDVVVTVTHLNPGKVHVALTVCRGYTLCSTVYIYIYIYIYMYMQILDTNNTLPPHNDTHILCQL
ncbi:unnamed protein product [Urochloa humidicola]